MQINEFLRIRDVTFGRWSAGSVHDQRIVHPCPFHNGMPAFAFYRKEIHEALMCFELDKSTEFTFRLTVGARQYIDVAARHFFGYKNHGFGLIESPDLAQGALHALRETKLCSCLTHCGGNQ